MKSLYLIRKEEIFKTVSSKCLLCFPCLCSHSSVVGLSYSNAAGIFSTKIKSFVCRGTEKKLLSDLSKCAVRAQHL